MGVLIGATTILLVGGFKTRAFSSFLSPDSYPPGLIYTANVTSDTLLGVMGYACDVNKYSKYPGVRPPGVWWATRPGSARRAAMAKKTTKRRKKK
jgi:hypothetical protein